MTTVLEMAEAHLLNVSREIQTLEQRKLDVESEIDRLKSYVNEAAGVVEGAKSEARAALANSATATSPSEDFPFKSVTG